MSTTLPAVVFKTFADLGQHLGRPGLPSQPYLTIQLSGAVT